MDTPNKERCLNCDRLKEENYKYVWNLGGCSTYAMGYDIKGGHDKKMALPALDDVLRLALKAKKLEEDFKVMREIAFWVHDQDFGYDVLSPKTYEDRLTKLIDQEFSRRRGK